MVLATGALLIFSILVIYKSSEWVIKYSVRLAGLLKVSTLVIGFVLVAIATSLPEIFVSVFAGLQGETNLGIGNILGSNLFNINVIIGLAVLVLGTIKIKRAETLHMVELLFLTSVVTLLIFSFSSLTMVHGVVLIILFGYVLVNLYKGGKVTGVFENEKIPMMPKEKRFLHFFRRPTLGMTAFKFTVSIVLLLAATKILVDSSIELALMAGLSMTFIGATIVAVGTSLPELAVTFASVRKKEYSLAMGDIVGSAVTNITLVLGILAMFGGVIVDTVHITSMLPFLIISTLYLWFIISKKMKIAKTEAVILLLIYAGFLMEQIGLITIFG